MHPPPPASHVFFLPFVNRGSLALADGWFTKSNAVPRLNKSARPPVLPSECLLEVDSKTIDGGGDGCGGGGGGGGK